MAHTNQTPNYELSQFLGTDKPAWLVDYNGDMEKIDLGLKAAKDVADAAKAEADQGALDIAAVTVTANSADAKASGAISDLADVYDASSTYNVGDYVIYNNILYKCIVNINVPESFDGNHWERTTVEEIVEGLNVALDQLNNDLTNLHLVNTYRSIAVGINVNTGLDYDGYIEVFGGNNGTTLVLNTWNISVPANTKQRYPVCAGEGVVRYTGGINATCQYIYNIWTITSNN